MNLRMDKSYVQAQSSGKAADVMVMILRSGKFDLKLSSRQAWGPRGQVGTDCQLKKWQPGQGHAAP